ncbi:ribonuclease Y [Fructilactobacillus sp. Tb1]|uniref:ribonuclease Y n=1 Tax=Fructilactobacillus sp. Tb1 TaxID=3422304 RepID=UPI003D27B772
MQVLLIASICLLVSGISGYVIQNKKLNHNLSDAEKHAEKIEENNQTKIKDSVAEINDAVKDDVEQLQDEEESDIEEQQTENNSRSDRLDFREKSLENSETRLNKNHQLVLDHQTELEDLRNHVSETKHQARELHEERNNTVYEKSKLTEDQAKQLVLTNTETTLNRDYEVTVRENHDDMVLNAAKDARNLMMEAIQSGVQDVPRDHIERNIMIPDAGIRNKITGRDEQRLRLIESLTGVDLIFHPEHEETLIISTNDPVRREIVRNAINELIAARSLNNGVIENTVADSERKVMDNLRIFGEETCAKLHLGWVHPDMMKILGRLKYRTSYGQNVLQHSVEVAELCGIMAAELGLNVRLAKRAGMFHDIGKALDREVNGTHVEIGVKIAEAYGEDPIVINAIAASHGDTETDNLISILVKVADSMSGARPGARSESVEEYINRLKGLERIANSHAGVTDSYAIQAGREIRIIVNPKEVNDEMSQKITEEVARQVEDELTYPGKIKITTIRKLAAVEYVGGKPAPKKKHVS